jgi:hypothetical protein
MALKGKSIKSGEKEKRAWPDPNWRPADPKGPERGF